MNDLVNIFRVPEQLSAPHTASRWTGFVLESGAILQQYHLAYTTYGRLNAAGDNVVWIFHALTGNSRPAEWWDGLAGPGQFFDPEKYFIVCVNTPGSCYGSSGPLSTDPATGQPFYHAFPFFTTRDLIRAYQPLKDFLGIKKIHIGIGGSMGGQQLLEWAIEEPGLFEHIIPIATNARHNSWGVAFNTTQRMAIEADATWRQQRPDAGIEGMKAARAIALLSYRNYDTYITKQPDNDNQLAITALGESTHHSAASYQRYQGQKLADRFNAFSYYNLSKTMDSHNVGRGRGGITTALQQITAKTLVIGIETDLLFPLCEQQFLAEQIPNAAFKVLHSIYGHDGFLLEYDQLRVILDGFLNNDQ